MNGTGTPATVDITGSAARRDPQGPSDGNARRTVSQKPFERFTGGPGTSPYLLLDSPSANGTISPYMAYVRPAQEQEQANREIERGGSADNGSDQPALPIRGSS